MFRTAPLALLSLAAALVALGCGSSRGDGEDTPVACLDGAGAYVGALDQAPGEVKLSGEVPISDCLIENQSGGDLSTMGEAMIEAATQLNAKAREAGGGKAAVELGYLIGAVGRGSQETEGIHSDLIRRLIVAARYSPGGQPLSNDVIVPYAEGFDAGRAGG
jgi:hypothetical protein